MRKMVVLRGQGVFRWSVIGASLVGAALSRSAHAQCQYDVTIIQAPECPPFGSQATFATGINELGHVVGYHCQCICGSNSAFVWTPESGLVTLDPPAGVYSVIASDINDAGQIVGTMSVSDAGDRGFVWQDGQWIELFPEGQGIHAGAYAINNGGQVVGYRDHDDGVAYRRYAFLWQDGVFTDIFPTQDGTAIARDVNQSGQVAGHMSWGPDWNDHAFLWEKGVTFDLGVIPGGLTGRGLGINSTGQVLVRGEFEDGQPEARIVGSFVWFDSDFTDLGLLQGYDITIGADLNSFQQVVGLCRAFASSNAPDVGFIWQNGLMFDLNDLLATEDGLAIRSAGGVNGSGQIVGTASGPNGSVAVLLTPIVFPLADLNGDCRVGAFDLALLLGSWGPCPPEEDCPADLNADDLVDTADLSILLGNWG